MKKSLVTLLIAALAVTTAALMSGCGSDTTSSDNTTPDTPPTTQESKDSDPSSQQTTVSDIISVPDSSGDTGSSDNSDNTATDLRRQIVATAEALVGIDYVSGMASPEQGFDNSGLIYYVLRENGFINCPRGTAAQKEMGTSIDFDDIREGDLLFFTDTDSETGEKIDFGGIYIGNGKLIYSPYPSEKVKFADINSAYWQNSFSVAISVA